MLSAGFDSFFPPKSWVPRSYKIREDYPNFRLPTSQPWAKTLLDLRSRTSNERVELFPSNPSEYGCCTQKHQRSSEENFTTSLALGDFFLDDVCQVVREGLLQSDIDQHLQDVRQPKPAHHVRMLIWRFIS